MDIVNLTVKAEQSGMYVTITVKFAPDAIIDFGATGEDYSAALAAAEKKAYEWGKAHGYA